MGWLHTRSPPSVIGRPSGASRPVKPEADAMATALRVITYSPALPVLPAHGQLVAFGAGSGDEGLPLGSEQGHQGNSLHHRDRYSYLVRSTSTA